MDEADLSIDDAACMAFIRERFDPAYYLAAYPDVAAAGADPLEHWLSGGFLERRNVSATLVLRYGAAARRSTNRHWRRLRWRGEDIAARETDPIPDEIMRQIANQARHDPAVLAGGREAIINLGPREGAGHVDVAGLRARLPSGGMDFLVIAPSLRPDQPLTHDIVAALLEDGRSVQTIVADEESPQDLGEIEADSALAKTSPLFWPDYLLVSPSVMRLAQLVRVLQPRATIVAGSLQGYEMVARYGRVLCGAMRLYCVYAEDLDPRSPCELFPRWTLPFATALTCDQALAARLRDRYGDLLGHGVMALPSRAEAPERFAAAVRSLAGAGGRPSTAATVETPSRSSPRRLITAASQGLGRLLGRP